MNKLFALTALTAALTFAGTTDASARTQLQSASQSRIAHQNFEAQNQTYALTGQTGVQERVEAAHINRRGKIITGGRSAR